MTPPRDCFKRWRTGVGTAQACDKVRVFLFTSAAILGFLSPTSSSMTVICPKCSHARAPDATNPDWQCPACGVCYDKVNGGKPEPARPARTLREGQVEVRQSWDLVPLLKIILVVAVGWGLSLAFRSPPEAVAEEGTQVAEVAEVAKAPESGAGLAFANTALQLSGADAGMLRSLTGRLEKACSRNKYGLNESACIERLHAREDVCASITAQQFPGQIGNTDRMQEITKAYVKCIFEG